jgi:hypothetical protein
VAFEALSRQLPKEALVHAALAHVYSTLGDPILSVRAAAVADDLNPRAMLLMRQSFASEDSSLLRKKHGLNHVFDQSPS